MSPDLKTTELPSAADRLIQLSEQAKADRNFGQAEHFLLLAWIAYESQAVERDEVEHSDTNSSPLWKAA